VKEKHGATARFDRKKGIAASRSLGSLDCAGIPNTNGCRSPVEKNTVRLPTPLGELTAPQLNFFQEFAITGFEMPFESLQFPACFLGLLQQYMSPTFAILLIDESICEAEQVRSIIRFD